MTRATAHPANRLANETSPYLLQHAHNPVDWYPWGPEALERAKLEDKPIFLSIGYSACHWCHVMERECFENEAIAAQMNQHFVNIKVDREERPDIDEIYMKAVVAMSGSGGWPMSVFLAPDQRPFFGATYLPPVRMHNRRAFPEILTSIAEVWASHRDEVLAQAGNLTSHIVEEAAADLRSAIDGNVLDRSMAELLQSFDATWGGFGRAPKFPHALDIRICLRHHKRTQDAAPLHAAVHTLDRMMRGGVYDQLGGGFHRYSTDTQWRIPHFEKMLYDNALLVPAYLEAHLVTGNTRFAEVASECCEWVLREMTTPEGGFASAQDADSEGEEGKFFVWTKAELVAVLGEQSARIVAACFNVTDEGNFEHGKSALWLPRPLDEVASELGVEAPALELEFRAASVLLLGAREGRVKPMTDDKVLVAWNGLMISALAQAYQVLDAPQYLDAARKAARYILTMMRKPDGSLLSTARAGHAHLDACLDDYAFMTQALIDLYESDFDPAWLREARALCTQIETRFWDTALGGYFTTGEGHEALIARTKNAHDGALPAGGGVQALNLARLAELLEDAELHAASRRAIDAYAKLANSHPRLFSQLLCAEDFHRAMPRQVVIAGEPESAEAQALLASVRRTFCPARVVGLATRASDAAFLPLLEGRARSEAQTAVAYVCVDRVCLAPVSTSSELRALLEPRKHS